MFHIQEFLAGTATGSVLVFVWMRRLVNQLRKTILDIKNIPAPSSASNMQGRKQ